MPWGDQGARGGVVTCGVAYACVCACVRVCPYLCLCMRVCPCLCLCMRAYVCVCGNVCEVV